MRLNFSEIIVLWLVKRLGASDKFRVMVKELAEEFYIESSLKKYRIWGDPSKLLVGKGVCLNNAVINTMSGKVDVRNYAFMGHNVSLLTGTHDFKQVGRSRQTAVPESERDIIVGEGVWVASNVTIIGPCKIGENAVIGAGSVITGIIPPNAIYAGIPARFVRNI